MPERFPFAAALWRRLRDDRGAITLAVLCAALVGACVAVQPLVVRWIIDDGLLRPVDPAHPDAAHERLHHALRWIGLFVVASILRVGVWNLALRWLVRAVENAQRRLRTALFRHLQRLCLRFHDRTPSGELFNALMGSPMAMLKVFLHECVLTIPYQAVSWVVALSALAWCDGTLTVLTIALAGGVALSTAGSRKAVRARTDRYLAVEAESSRRIADLLRGLRETKIQAREQEAEQAVGAALAQLHEEGRALAVTQHLHHARPELARYLAQAALFAVGAWRVAEGQLAVGAFVAFLMTFDTLMNPLLTVLRMGLVAANARAGLARVEALLAVSASTPEPEPAQAVPIAQALVRPGPALALRGVRFGYDPSRPVFADLDLAIPRGQRVALVGASGSGKSTLVALLLRLYDVDAGAVEVHGVDVRRLRGQELRSSFAVVPQAPFIFDRTLRENLLISAPSARDADLWRALAAARLEDDVRALPQGLDTAVGEGGCALSGGQRQRLAIARALLTGAPFLILDEATSALDAVSERAVQQALDEAFADRTVVVIAHRLSTVRHVDRILVFAGGRIVQDGTYAALADRPGPFRDLLRAADGAPAAA